MNSESPKRAYRQSARALAAEGTATRILERLQAAHARGELAVEPDEVHAWAIMGMNVFLGLRYGVWNPDRSIEEVAAGAEAILRHGLMG